MSLEALCQLSSSAENIAAILNYLSASDGFETLNGLYALVSYEEDIKKPKPKKGSVEPPLEIPENDNVIKIRRLSLQILNLFTQAVAGYENEIRAKLSNSIVLMDSIIKRLQIMAKAFSDEKQVESSSDEFDWISSVIGNFFDWSEAFISSFLTKKGFEPLSTFISLQRLSLSCLKLVEKLSRVEMGLFCVSMDIKTFEAIVNCFNLSSGKFDELQAQSAVPEKGKAPKKDDKSKKGAPIVETPTISQGSDISSLIGICNYSSLILRYVFEKNLVFVDDGLVSSLIISCGNLLKNGLVIEALRSSVTTSINLDISLFVFNICGLMGSISCLNPTVRNICLSNGVIKVIIQTMAQSLSYVGLAADNISSASDLQIDVLNGFLTCAEKALIGIIVSPRIVPSEFKPRWLTCGKYVSDMECIENSFSTIMEMATNLQDSNLCKRALRIISFVLLSSVDPVEFCNKFKFDSAFTGKLANVLNQFMIEVQEVSEDSEAPVSVLKPPSTKKAIFFGLLIMEVLIDISSDIVNAFITKERVGVMRDIIYLAGPYAANRSSIEWKLNLFNTFNYDWTLKLLPNASNDSILFRPVLVRVLDLICRSSLKYRPASASTPFDPLVPPAVNFSPTHDAAITVAKICGDAVCSVILADVHYKICCGSIFPAMVSQRCVMRSLMSCCLSFMCGISNCDALGSYALLESLSESFISSKQQSSKKSAMFWLLDIFDDIKFSSILKDKGIDPIDRESYSWSRALFFDELFAQFSGPVNVVSLNGSFSFWPYAVMLSALIGILSDYRLDSSCTSFCLESLSRFLRIPDFTDAAQPVICDQLCAIFISMGGLQVLTGQCGRFGTISISDKVVGKELLSYLINRAITREQFWTDALDKKLKALPIDPKTGKPVLPKKDGKDSKADKKKDPKAVPPIIEEVVYYFDPSSEYPDPNHGPTKSFWITLLNQQCYDVHLFCEYSTCLISAIQSELFDIALSLIDNGVDVNLDDNYGRVPLMYGLIVGDERIIKRLITAHADLNVIDYEGNPLVKYSFFSLQLSDIEKYMKCHFAKSPLFGVTVSMDTGKICCHYAKLIRVPISIPLLGRNPFFRYLCEAKVDLKVSDVDGQFPVHYCVGLCQAKVQFGGYLLNLKFGGYELSTDICYSSFKLMESLDYAIDSCNKACLTPLHVAAARGDIVLVNYLLSRGANGNITDGLSLLPLHYCVGACPPNAIELFDILCKFSSDRPLDQGVYVDERTGKPSTTKYGYDLHNYVGKTIREELNPSILGRKRLSLQEILCLRCHEGMSIIDLCMVSNVFGLVGIVDYVQGGKMERINLIMHIMKVCDPFLEMLLNGKDDYGMNTLHAASLLLQHRSPQIELSEKERRSKRVKKYPSEELHMMDVIFSRSKLDVNDICERFLETQVENRGLPTKWTPLHGCILNDNFDFAQLLFSYDPDLQSQQYIHYLARFPCSDELNEIFVQAAVKSPRADHILNSEGLFGLPLNLAVRHRNFGLLALLLQCSQVDVNRLDMLSSQTAFEECCRLEDLECLEVFAPYLDRLRLTSVDSNNRRGFFNVIQRRSKNILEFFIKYCLNDVVIPGILDHGEHGEDSLLLQLEAENLALCESIFGIGPNNIEYMDREGKLLPSEEKPKFTNASEELKWKLEDNCDVLHLLLPLVKELDFVSCSYHLHSCFYDGLTFNDIISKE